MRREMEYLKCAPPTCDCVGEYEQITEDMIDTSCPVCGANLLTEQDYYGFNAEMQVMSAIEDMVEEDMDDEKALIHTHFHNGKLTIELS